MGRAGPMEDPSRRGSTRENPSWAGEEGQADREACNNGRAQGSKTSLGLRLSQGEGSGDQ